MAMIKCPECGLRISSMAMTCPHCGVAIKGHLHECPECGEYVLDSHTECPECGAELDFAPQTGDDAKPTLSPQGGGEPDGSGGGHALLWTIVALLVVCGVGGGLYLFDQYRLREEQRIREQDSIKRLMAIRFEQELEAARHKDSVDWRLAMADGSEEAIRRYKIIHDRDGEYLDSADLVLEQLSRLRVSDQDKILVRNVIEERLAQIAKDPKAAGKDVIGLHYQIEGPLTIERQIDSDGTVSIKARCNVSQTMTRTDPTKATSSVRSLTVIMDENREIKSFKM